MKPQTPTTEQTTALIQLAKILSNPVRIKMLIYIYQARYVMCSSFPRMLEGVSQPQASMNLKKFLDAGLVTKQKVGNTWIYELNQEKWSAIQHLGEIAAG